jgi:hypothetical protein
MRAEFAMIHDSENSISATYTPVGEKKRHLLFFVQKRLQLFRLVVLLQPILVRLQHCQGRRARKDGYITPEYALLPNRRRAFFFAFNFYSRF